MSTTLAAGAAGLILGCPVALIWLFVSCRLEKVEFWPACRQMTQSLVGTVDPREFADQYVQFLKLFARYLARNVLLTVAAALPVIPFVLLFAPATEVEALAQVGNLQSSGGPGNSFWSWASGPEAAFFVGLGTVSTSGICLFSKRSR
jgi:hypothetical protein